jgi:hypothetical protein
MPNDFKISPNLAYAAGGILVGTLAGFVLGRTTAPIQTRPSNHINLVDSEEEDNIEEEDSQEGLNGFPNSHEECKMVLVVRTDLGMTKGSSFAQLCICSADADAILRQNSSSVLSRDTRMLQDSLTGRGG